MKRLNLERIIAKIKTLEVGDYLENEPLYKHTTFKVGGPCRLYVKVHHLEALKVLLSYLKEEQVPHYLIGNGSNLLFSDREFEGVIISLNEYFADFKINGCDIEAQAGVNLIYLANQACKYGLSGLEFAGGIPGSVGGAVFMNAGAYLSDISALITSVTILDENLEIQTLTNEQMKFAYRHSIIQEHPEWIILSCTLRLKPKDPKTIQALMDNRKEKRMMTQPWNFPSAGSVFRNPEAKSAWQCIDECGLRGWEIGGAQISPKHSNFIVNNGYASARDILDLIQLAQKVVKERFDIDLVTEVRLVNW